MSAPNTRESKLTRLLKRQAEDSATLSDIEATIRLDHQVRALNNATMKAQSETIRRLLRQHDTLRQMPSWPLVERELIAANALASEPSASRSAPIAVAESYTERVSLSSYGIFGQPPKFDCTVCGVTDKPCRHHTSPRGPVFTLTGLPSALTSNQHNFDEKGRRCTRCHCLKAALEASGEGCVTGAPL